MELLFQCVSPVSMLTEALMQVEETQRYLFYLTLFLEGNFLPFVSLCSHLTELLHLCRLLDSVASLVLLHTAAVFWGGEISIHCD